MTPAVHPRVCGERSRAPRNKRENIGSSPRVRGTRRRRAGAGASGRFIPACAGNAPACRQCWNRAAVHPRVCGERGTLPSRRTTRNGSSPRVRGTLKRVALASVRRRFIPACAGNAVSCLAAPRRNAVHPRVCGERFLILILPPIRGGSSPRVRGTRFRASSARATRRFIPACAGNARPRFSKFSTPPVHPRVCGERAASKPMDSMAFGSSPRVRGTLAGWRMCPIPSRFIPACAGNAASRRSAHDPPPVHPRVCGERQGYLARCSG